MLQMSSLEFLFRGIPESFLLIFMSYLFAHKKVDKKLCLISTIVYSITVYLVRLLPIHFGVHTMMLMMIYIIIIVSINRIPINNVISSILIGMIVLTMCELINLFVLDKWLKFNMEFLQKNPLMKTWCFMPSLLLFGVIDLILYIFVYKSEKMSKKCLKLQAYEIK